MKKKNVLEIVPHFPFVKSFIGNRLKYMSKKGFNSFLVCNNNAANIDEYATEHNFKNKSMVLSRMPSFFSDLKAFFVIKKYIKENKIDLIVGHMDKGVLMATLLGMVTGKKTIIYAHGTSFETGPLLKRRFFIVLNRVESYFSDAVICVSKYLTELRYSKHIDNPTKQFVPGKGSCTGVDCDVKFNPDLIEFAEKESLRKKLGFASNDFVVGFCGRLTRDKGIEELVTAFNLIEKDSPNVKLLLVGDSDIRDSVSAETMAIIDNSSKIVKTGFIEENIQLYYSLMDVFVLPTHRDGFGMCLVEAAAMGVPVITTFFTGSRDAVKENYNAFYISLDPKDIAEKISKLKSDAPLRAKFISNSRKWVVDNFKQEYVWNEIIKIYEKVLCSNNK